MSKTETCNVPTPVEVDGIRGKNPVYIGISDTKVNYYLAELFNYCSKKSKPCVHMSNGDVMLGKKKVATWYNVIERGYNERKLLISDAHFNLKRVEQAYHDSSNKLLTKYWDLIRKTFKEYGECYIADSHKSFLDCQKKESKYNFIHIDANSNGNVTVCTNASLSYHCDKTIVVDEELHKELNKLSNLSRVRSERIYKLEELFIYVALKGAVYTRDKNLTVINVNNRVYYYLEGRILGARDITLIKE